MLHLWLLLGVTFAFTVKTPMRTWCTCSSMQSPPPNMQGVLGSPLGSCSVSSLPMRKIGNSSHFLLLCSQEAESLCICYILMVQIFALLLLILIGPLFYFSFINFVSFMSYPKSFHKEVGNFEIKIICTYWVSLFCTLKIKQPQTLFMRESSVFPFPRNTSFLATRCGGFSPLQEILVHQQTPAVSYNLAQCWHCLPGDNFRSHNLRARFPQACPQLQMPNTSHVVTCTCGQQGISWSSHNLFLGFDHLNGWQNSWKHLLVFTDLL